MYKYEVYTENTEVRRKYITDFNLRYKVDIAYKVHEDYDIHDDEALCEIVDIDFTGCEDIYTFVVELSKVLESGYVDIKLGDNINTMHGYEISPGEIKFTKPKCDWYITKTIKTM